MAEFFKRRDIGMFRNALGSLDSQIVVCWVFVFKTKRVC